MLKNAKKLLLVMCCMASFAMAHPHVFADISITALFEGSGLVGIQNHWVYDEVYSSAMVASADVNGDGKLSGNEIQTIRQLVLDPMEKNNYFNYILMKTDFLKNEGIKDFKAVVQNGKLVLDFIVKFSIPAATDYTMLVVVVGDPSNYIQMTVDMENADAKAPAGMEVEYFSDSIEGLTLYKAFPSATQALYLRYKK